MWNIVLIALGVIAVFVIVVLVLAYRKPDVFHVVRSTTIDAPPEKVFGYLNDFRKWTAWSPWEKLDPQLQRTYSGASSGTGAKYAWEGNKQVGAGSMEITESRSPSRIALNLDFSRPFEAHNVTEFTFEPVGNGTRIVWDMHGPNQCMGRIMSVFIDMDEMVGKDFETGLANLKAAAEGGR
jgi:uncharacterized protein YndB with AHSA1/START domain